MKKICFIILLLCGGLLNSFAALQLQRSVPADGGSQIALDSRIVLVFNENAYLGSGDCRLNEEELTPSFSGKYVTLAPSSMEYAITYTFTAEAGAFVNAAGEKSPKITFSFTTKSPTPKLFDAIVAQDSTGDYVKVQEAIDNAPSNRTQPWLIFIKKGTYNELIRIPSTKPFIHLIGEDLENTKIQYKINCGSSSSDAGWDYSCNKLGLSDGSVVVVSAPNFYTENISYINTWGYEAQNGPQALVFKTFQDKIILNNCRLISYQDTWQTSARNATDRHYAKNCFIEGAVDFIYCAGDCYFDACTLSIARTNGAVIVAPSHDIGTKWGYIFMNCTIDAPKTATNVYFGRPWHNAPKASFVNTRLTKKVSIAAAGWMEHMGAIPAIFADYNTTDYLGNPVDLSKRIDTYWYTDANNQRIEGTAQKTLSNEEVAQYTLKNVLRGSDNWRPEYMTKAPATPVITCSDNEITWEAIDIATCYIIIKNGNVAGFTVDNHYRIDDASASYQIRASNEYGALSELSNSLVPAGIGSTSASKPEVSIQQQQVSIHGISEQTNVLLYSLSGILLHQEKTIADTIIQLPRNGRYILQLITNKNCFQYII